MFRIIYLLLMISFCNPVLSITKGKRLIDEVKSTRPLKKETIQIKKQDDKIDQELEQALDDELKVPNRLVLRTYVFENLRSSLC